MKEQEIGELYQQKLAGLQSQPPAGMWEKIQQDAAVKKFTRHRQMRFWGLRVALPTLIVASVVAVLLVLQKDVSSIESQPVASKSAVEVPATPLAPITAQTSVPASTAPTSVPTATATPNRTPFHTAPATSVITISTTAQETHANVVAEKAAVSHNTMPTATPTHNKTVSPVTHPAKDGKETFFGGHATNEQVYIERADNSLIFSNDTMVCRNSSVTIFVKNAQSVWWSFGSQKPAETIIIEEPTQVEATVQTNEGKDTVIRINIGVYDCELFIPTAFTPNDDGLNDEWIVYAPATFTNFECSVYDKTGRMLFHSKNIHQGWDGKSSEGKYMTTGAYFYVCTYRDEMGQKRVQKGQVTLIR